GHFIIFDSANLHFVHILPADFDRTMLCNNSNATFEILVPYGCRVVEATLPALYKIKTHNTCIFKICQRLMVVVRKPAVNVFDISEKPIHDIDEMRKLCKQCSPIQILLAMP